MPAHRPLALVIGASLLLTLAGCKSTEHQASSDEHDARTNYARVVKDYQRAVARGDLEEARRAYEDVRRLGHLTPKDSQAQASLHLRRGQQALAAGNPVAAIPELERALELAPSHPGARAALDRAEREQLSRTARADAAYTQGMEAQKLGHLQESRRRFDEALELNPNHAGAAAERARIAAERVEQLVARGDKSAERGEWAQALALYEQARSRGPSSSHIHARISQMRRELEADVWIEQGDRARSHDDWQEAYECYEQARLLTTAPERVRELVEVSRAALVAELLRNAGTAEVDGRLEEARSSYRAILELQPDHSEARRRYDDMKDRFQTAESAYRNGYAALRQSNLVLAQQSFDECTKTLPMYLDAAERLADVHHEIKLAETMYDLGRKAEDAGDRTQAGTLYAECLTITRPFRDAKERLDALIAPAGDEYEPFATYEEACRAQARWDYERAWDLLLQCQRERPGYRDVTARIAQITVPLELAARVYWQAEAAARRHDLAGARDAYIKCLRISSPYRDADERLAPVETSLMLLREAQLLEQERRLVDALDHYRKVLEYFPTHPHAGTRVSELERECNKLADDYTRMITAERKGRYHDALRTAVEIRKRSSGYRDVDRRMAQLEIEADYERARSFEETGRWELASRAYERCVERDPDFRDARDRWNRVRGKTSDGGREPTRDGNPSSSSGSARRDGAFE